MIDSFSMHIINDEWQKIMGCYGNFEKYMIAKLSSFRRVQSSMEYESGSSMYYIYCEMYEYVSE